MDRMIETVIKEIPLEQIQGELPQPRKELGVDEDNRLMASLKEEGLGSAITVIRAGKDEYKIANGHRRFQCAQLLGWKTIRCEVYPDNLDEGELEKLRFNLQTNFRPWKPLERSEELKRIKDKKNFKSNKELAEYLHYPEALLSTSLSVQKKLERYQNLIKEYELSHVYQAEFVKLYPKIRPIKEFTVDDIIRNIFTRVKHKVIASAKDFRKLSSVFIRAHANEETIHRFLKDPDMKVDDLYKLTERSGYVRDVEHALHQTADKLTKNIEFSDDEENVLKDFFDLLTRKFNK